MHLNVFKINKVCSLSKIQADLESMIALCTKTNNDIRSSINTLQFLSKKTNSITARMINQLNIGQKDYEKGFFTIINEIFLKKENKR